MRLRRSGLKKARIEIIPMIDTMFFLLVFFMLASLTMVQQPYTVPVNLPKAGGVQEKMPVVVTVTVTEDGRLFYNKDAISSPADAAVRLLQQHKNEESLAVIINADANVKHGLVVEVLDAIQQSGLAKIAVAINHVKNKS